MEEKKKKTGTWKRAVMTAVCVVLALVLGVMVFATIYIENLMNQMGRPDDSTLSSEQIDELLKEEGSLPSGTIDWVTEPEYTIDGEHIFNILLIGQDRRPGEGRQRSDSMILCTINTKAKTLTMTSFMRDLYVPIPGYRDGRINTCYPLGGMPLLNQCLKLNFGVEVDGNIEVDFNGFVEVIDLLDGVDLHLTASEVKYMNGTEASLAAPGGSWNFKVGKNHLNGEQALLYSRIRHIVSDDHSLRPDSDFGRTYRQRNVLMAIMEKAKTLPLTKLDALAKSIVKLVTTDMENSEIMKYITMLLPMLGELQVTTMRIPADGAFTDEVTSNGLWVLVPDLKKNQQLLADALKDE